MVFTAAQMQERFLLALSAAAVLATAGHAQPAPQAPAGQAANATVTAAAPKYATKDIERAFAFIDSNKDGKLSREEASGFRGVARHFDEADANKDNTLSREEFHSALNGERSR
ncbi:EF-hand domain-containing protein [Polaromonas sp.]|uniref:EF-hand domain-containing protein n=1 Tax=Polaromonas sp. TaxID=1869339 RepID=UPI003266B998